MDSEGQGDGQMRRINCVLLGLFLWTPVFASEPEIILGPEDEVTAPVLEEAPVIHLKTAKKERAASFSLRGGWSQRNYRLTSSGVNTNIPGGSGYEVEGTLEKETNDGQKLSASFQWGTHAFTGITSFTPSNFRINSMQANVQYGFLVFGEAAPRAQSWWLWVGYEAKKRTGQAGLPLSPMTDVFFHGFRAGLSYEGPNLWGNFGFAASTFLMLPIFFREDVETTGSYRFGLTSESAFMVRYALRDALSISVGGRFYLDYRTYFGTGTRNSVNATELEPVISIPIEIQIRF